MGHAGASNSCDSGRQPGPRHHQGWLPVALVWTASRSLPPDTSCPICDVTGGGFSMLGFPSPGQYHIASFCLVIYVKIYFKISCLRLTKQKIQNGQRNYLQKAMILKRTRCVVVLSNKSKVHCASMVNCFVISRTLGFVSVM